MPRTKNTDMGFELYSTGDYSFRTIVQVSDPLHIEILNDLSVGPMSTTEISESTGKAQSTLSVHLDTMVAQGLISSEYDRNDSRRKIYSISSRKIAGKAEPFEGGLDVMMKFIKKSADSTTDLYKSMMMTVLVGAESGGLDVSYGMELLASIYSDELAKNMSSNKVEDVIRELQDFYERNLLGEVCIYTFLPLTIIIRNTDEFPFKLSSLAAFSKGLFVSLLNKITQRTYEVTKSEIFGTGNNYYKFVIELAK